MKGRQYRSRFEIVGKLVTMISPLSHIMALAILAGVLGFLASIFITILGGYAILDLLKLPGGINTKTVFIMVISFAVLRGILRYIEQTSNHYIAFKILAIIRDKMFKALRKLAPAKLEGKDKGDLISMITSDVELLEVFYAHTVSPVIIAFLTSLIMSIFIGSFDYRLGIFAACGYLTVGLLLPYITSKRGKADGEDNRKVFSELNTLFLDSLRGMKESIQYDYSDSIYSKVQDRTEELNEINKKLKNHEGDSTALTNMVIVAFSIGMIILSYLIKSTDTSGLGLVLIPSIAMMSSFGPVVALSALMNNLLLTLACGERVLEILEEEPVTEDIASGRNVGFNDIEYKDVNFSYNENQVLKDFNLKIKKNEIVGVSGRSGCGKSTALKLLLRFWSVDKGEIDINDENIENINTECLRNMMSFMTQDTVLFNESIKNNIKIAKLDATDDEIVEAAQKASIHEFIQTLPDEYETTVGELGDKFSGGEVQRIGLARAFLHDAPLMILDEPTSNLDSLNEGIILKALKEGIGRKSIVIVSHRKSTMNIVDRNCTISNGRVISEV